MVCFLAILTKNDGPRTSVEKLTLYFLLGSFGSYRVENRFSFKLPSIIFLIPKKFNDFLGAYKKVLSNTSPAEITLTSHLSFESAMELGLSSAPWIPE